MTICRNIALANILLIGDALIKPASAAEQIELLF